MPFANDLIYAWPSVGVVSWVIVGNEPTPVILYTSVVLKDGSVWFTVNVWDAETSFNIDISPIALVVGSVNVGKLPTPVILFTVVVFTATSAVLTVVTVPLGV